jgi:hypothetical protein
MGDLKGSQTISLTPWGRDGFAGDVPKMSGNVRWSPLFRVLPGSSLWGQPYLVGLETVRDH